MKSLLAAALIILAAAAPAGATPPPQATGEAASAGAGDRTPQTKDAPPSQTVAPRTMLPAAPSAQPVTPVAPSSK